MIFLFKDDARKCFSNSDANIFFFRKDSKEFSASTKMQNVERDSKTQLKLMQKKVKRCKSFCFFNNDANKFLLQRCMLQMLL
jgi:hypothetical protein